MTDMVVRSLQDTLGVCSQMKWWLNTSHIIEVTQAVFTEYKNLTEYLNSTIYEQFIVPYGFLLMSERLFLYTVWRLCKLQGVSIPLEGINPLRGYQSP